MLAAPDCALDDEMVTMRPHPADSMSATAACRQWNVPVRLTARTRPRLGCDLGERGELVQPCARDHDLDGAELCADLAQRFVDRRTVGDVDLAGERVAIPHVFGGALRSVTVEVEQRDAVTGFCEAPAHREPHPGCGAGHDGHPTHELPLRNVRFP